ncbi:GWxTD domain-containing protein [bacterium]|nr:GWxTD domain-containing protein [bacterium]
MVKLFPIFLVICLCLGTFLKVNAQWEAAVKYIFQPDYNTVVYLQPTSETSDKIERSPTMIEVGIRKKGNNRTFHQKSYSLLPGTNPIPPIRFNLPKGDYLIDIDLSQGVFAHIQLGYTCAGKPGEVAASDLLLSYAPIRNPNKLAPILSSSLDKKETAFFFIEIYSSTYKKLTARAVLYKENKGKRGSLSTTYQSLQQINRILTLSRGKVFFTDKYELGALDEGVYLIEILIYENDRQIEEKSTQFVIEWKGKSTILNEINTSIRMTKYLLGESDIEAMMALPSIDSKKLAFLEHWQRMYPSETDVQMVAYFKKIQQANKRFTTGMPGWMTDRGKTFVLYGEPVVNTINKAEKTIEKWTYPEWNLSFLFEKRNQVFYLTE